jgi:hypothetical protein
MFPMIGAPLLEGNCKPIEWRQSLCCVEWVKHVFVNEQLVFFSFSGLLGKKPTIDKLVDSLIKELDSEVC